MWSKKLWHVLLMLLPPVTLVYFSVGGESEKYIYSSDEHVQRRYIDNECIICGLSKNAPIL